MLWSILHEYCLFFCSKRDCRITYEYINFIIRKIPMPPFYSAFVAEMEFDIHMAIQVENTTTGFLVVHNRWSFLSWQKICKLIFKLCRFAGQILSYHLFQRYKQTVDHATNEPLLDFWEYSLPNNTVVALNCSIASKCKLSRKTLVQSKDTEGFSVQVLS